MRALIILSALATPAFADSDARVLAQAQIAADAKLRPIDPTTKKPVTSWKCSNGVMTAELVSWSCEGRSGDVQDLVSGAGVHRAFTVQGGKLVPFDLFAEVTSKEALKEAFARRNSMTLCDPLKFGVAVTAQGLVFYAANEGPTGCLLVWSEAYRALKKNGVLAPIVRATKGSRWEQSYIDPDRRIRSKDDLPQVQAGKTPATRFVREGDYGVKDTQTGLVWLANLPPADVAADEAAMFAERFRAGGHTDWRLPTIDELVALATPDLAHAEPGDCTGGKSKYTITPLIHLTCGLAWSLTPTTNVGEYAAFGFISGTPRIAKGSERKNYRTLLVRGP